jgi:hypothetical protein
MNFSRCILISTEKVRFNNFDEPPIYFCFSKKTTGAPASAAVMAAANPHAPDPMTAISAFSVFPTA